MIGWIDIESRSKLNLKHVGTDAYSRDCEVIIAAFAPDDDDVTVWEAGQPKSEFKEFLLEADVLVAHNVWFEFNVFKNQKWCNRPVDDWGCTMAQAFSHALPGALADLCRFMGVPEDQQKKTDGKKLIRTFCKLQRNGEFKDREDLPDDWERFLDYGAHDVIAMRECHRRMPRVNYDACCGFRT